MSDNGQAEKFKTVSKQIENACREGATICTGDWNIDLRKIDQENYYLKKVAAEYKSCAAICGLKQLDFGITHQRIHRDGKIIESAIDHCTTNKPELINDYHSLDINYSPDPHAQIHKSAHTNIYTHKHKPTHIHKH